MPWNLMAATAKYKTCYHRIWCHCAAEYKWLQLLSVWKPSIHNLLARPSNHTCALPYSDQFIYEKTSSFKSKYFLVKKLEDRSVQKQNKATHTHRIVYNQHTNSLQLLFLWCSKQIQTKIKPEKQKKEPHTPII